MKMQPVLLSLLLSTFTGPVAIHVLAQTVAAPQTSLPSTGASAAAQFPSQAVTEKAPVPKEEHGKKAKKEKPPVASQIPPAVST